MTILNENPSWNFFSLENFRKNQIFTKKNIFDHKKINIFDEIVLKFIFRFSTFDLNHLWRTSRTLRPQECPKLKKEKIKESGSRPGPERARTLWGYS